MNRRRCTGEGRLGESRGHRHIADQGTQFLGLQASLRLQAEELCALISDMPVSTAFPQPPSPVQRRLFERVFNLPQLSRLRPPIGDW